MTRLVQDKAKQRAKMDSMINGRKGRWSEKYNCVSNNKVKKYKDSIIIFIGCVTVFPQCQMNELLADLIHKVGGTKLIPDSCMVTSSLLEENLVEGDIFFQFLGPMQGWAIICSMRPQQKRKHCGRLGKGKNIILHNIAFLSISAMKK